MPSNTRSMAAVLGAGSWGTALAIQLARNGHDVRLWGYESRRNAAAEKARNREVFLPGFELADNIKICAELADAVEARRRILIAIPSKGFRALLQRLKPLIEADCRACSGPAGVSRSKAASCCTKSLPRNYRCIATV